jgi:hypothetical protein
MNFSKKIQDSLMTLSWQQVLKETQGREIRCLLEFFLLENFEYVNKSKSF